MSATRQIADDRCPRCGGGFRCGVRDAAPCACTGLRLDTALQAQLRERYTGCLCLGCLQALADAASRGQSVQALERSAAACG